MKKLLFLIMVLALFAAPAQAETDYTIYEGCAAWGDVALLVDPGLERNWDLHIEPGMNTLGSKLVITMTNNTPRRLFFTRKMKMEALAVENTKKILTIRIIDWDGRVWG